MGVCYRDACVPDGTTASGGVLPRGPSREKAHEIRADVTVLCNGTGVEALARKAGYSVRMVPRPGMLAHARLSPGAGDNGRLGKIVVTPWLHMLQVEPDARRSRLAGAKHAAGCLLRAPRPAPQDDDD